MTILHSVLNLAMLTLSGLVGMPVVIGAVLTTEAPILTLQRVMDIKLANASVGARQMFREWFSYLNQTLGAINLQMIEFSDLTADTNPLDGTLRVYAVWAKKQATATDSFYKIFDDATDDSTAADAMLALGLLESSKEVMAFWPDGLPLTAGLVHGAYTTLAGFNGATPSTSGDGPNGFLLVG